MGRAICFCIQVCLCVCVCVCVRVGVVTPSDFLNFRSCANGISTEDLAFSNRILEVRHSFVFFEFSLFEIAKDKG